MGGLQHKSCGLKPHHSLPFSSELLSFLVPLFSFFYNGDTSWWTSFYWLLGFCGMWVFICHFLMYSLISSIFCNLLNSLAHRHAFFFFFWLALFLSIKLQKIWSREEILHLPSVLWKFSCGRNCVSTKKKKKKKKKRGGWGGGYWLDIFKRCWWWYYVPPSLNKYLFRRFCSIYNVTSLDGQTVIVSPDV